MVYNCINMPYCTKNPGKQTWAYQQYSLTWSPICSSEDYFHGTHSPTDFHWFITQHTVEPTPHAQIANTTYAV